ncbi:MAG TPA: amidohydrolase family protein [Candidatus Binataceae bacterium]|nr:amidohydrolase family protein [Candidatus Binataceae bacterium]
MSERSRSAAVRERLSHPIIDSDGHVAEFEPALFDYLKDVAGSAMVERFKRLPDSPMSFRWSRLTPEERRRERVPRPHWWVHPTRNTLDRATSSLPRLLYERLDELGLDYTMIYPSIGLFALHLGDDELRGALCRAYNKLHSHLYKAYQDRVTPVGVIPMHSPAEAIAELEYAVGTLGLKAIVMAGWVRRPLAAAANWPPEAARHAWWLDTLALDGAHDYDPVWRKCLELKVAPAFHSLGAGIGFRNSISNFMYNHIGHFAASSEAICKAIFFGGVTHRFPDLRFSFLEGGAGWACSMYNDLIGHWEKHNIETIRNFDPANLDRELLGKLFREYGDDYGAGLVARLGQDESQLGWGSPQAPENLDEWARCGVASKEDIRQRFIPKFSFGCEGDDRMTALAFSPQLNPTGSRLAAIYSSDLGHWDLTDMRDAAYEAWELVEHGLINEDDFRDFVFVNAVRAKTDVNPDFFKGTVVEGAAARLLAG